MIDQVELGRSGVHASRLCFGTGTQGWKGRSDQGDLGVAGLARLLRQAHELGVTFWDTADQYGTHPHVAAALDGLDRDSVTVATKTVSRTAGEVEADVERFLRELRTDYIDILLLHCLSSAAWPEDLRPAMDVLRRCKERSLVRAVGCSCHDFGALRVSADCEWNDVNLVRINHAGENMCAPPERVVPVIERMAAAGKGVYGMKVMGGGKLAESPQKAIRFAGGLAGVHALVVGMLDEDQLRRNVGLVGALPGSPALG